MTLQGDPTTANSAIIVPLNRCDDVRGWNQPASFQLRPQRARPAFLVAGKLHTCGLYCCCCTASSHNIGSILRTLLQPVATTTHAKLPYACLSLWHQPQLIATNMGARSHTARSCSHSLNRCCAMQREAKPCCCVGCLALLPEPQQQLRSAYSDNNVASCLLSPAAAETMANACSLLC